MDPVQHFTEMMARDAYWEQVAQWGYTLFFVFFAAGALLLLAAPFLPAAKDGRGTSRGTLAACSAIVLLFLLSISLQLNIDQRRGFLTDQDRHLEALMHRLATQQEREQALQSQYLYLPQGESLKYISLGNTALASDYVWLSGTQYVSNAFRRGNKFEMLYRFYSTMMDLDPHWIEGIMNAGKVLSALEPDRFKVEKFYIQALEKNPGNWRLEYEAGRLFVVPPMDPAQRGEYSKHAADWFALTLKHLHVAKVADADNQGMIKSVEGLNARLGMEAGYYEAAAELLWKHLTDTKSPLAFRQISACDYLNAQSLVYVTHLQALIARFKKDHGDNFPPSLEAVFAEWPEKRKECSFTLRGPALDAFGYPLTYNPRTGVVASRGVNVRRAIGAAAVLGTLIDLFASSEGRKPRDILELRDYVRKVYEDPRTRSTTLLDCFGIDIDLTRCPIGEWDYDPVAGKINLPPDCDAKLLYRNAYRIVKE